MLLNGYDALRIAESKGTSLSPRLRYGSQGALVGKVQAALREQGFYEGAIDNDFGIRTLRAVMLFQEKYFGTDAEDGW